MGIYADLITDEIQPKIDNIDGQISDLSTLKTAIDGLGTFTSYPVDGASPTPSESDFLAMTDIFYGTADVAENPYREAVATGGDWESGISAENLKEHTGRFQNWLNNNESQFTSDKAWLESKKTELQELEDNPPPSS